MRRQTVLVLVLCLVFSTALCKAGPVEWSVSDGGNGHFYEAFHPPISITWDEAQSEALSMGGYLVTITSPEENEFVFSLIESPEYWSYRVGAFIGPWTGGLQQPGSEEPAGGWGWVTGEPFSFAAWDPVQPNDASGQDRIHFWNLYSIAPTWQDVRYNSPSIQSYVVEIVPIPAPSAILLGSIGAGLVGLVRRRRN